MTPSDPAPWEGRVPVFVGGMHRSGTTAVASILSSSDDATGLDDSDAVMGEGQFLQDVYPIEKAFGGVTGWAFNPKARFTEADVRPDTAERLWSAWAPYWDAQARFVVEKSPLNMVRTRFLKAMFPEARFVVITRHPITQALAVHKWARTRLRRSGFDFSRLVEHWVAAHRMAAADLDQVDDVLVVRFEHLMSTPERELPRIAEFVGLELPENPGATLNESVLTEYAALWDRLRTGRGKQYADHHPKRLLQNVIARAVFPREARKMRQHADTVSEFGYDLDDLINARPWPR